MIFEKATYLKSGVLKSFQKRISLSFLKTKDTKPFDDCIETRYPRINTPLKEEELEALNSICHVNAFVVHNKKLFVKRYTCDSCADCSTLSHHDIEMGADEGREELILLSRK